MNTVEHIVEAYYRICKQCFTMQDVKVMGGNNRQIDLLAVNLSDGLHYHVESSVTHCAKWCPDASELKLKFDKKFLGKPSEREGPKRDFARGKIYRQQIFDTYTSFGMSLEKLQRVWVFWTMKCPDKLAPFLESYKNETGLHVQTLSLRDDIIPALQERVETSNYDDEVLRTLSLLKQMVKQTQ